MKYIGFLLFLCVIMGSCDYFEKRKVNADELLNESLKSFNWNEVDEYPTFVSCDSAYTKAEKKQCFENTLSQQITAQLAERSIIVTEDLNDTIILEFQISENGEILLKNRTISESVDHQIPQFDSIINNSLANLPKILPAIKRGQQVKTEFTMPVVFKVN